jgi:hypothetical protein
VTIGVSEDEKESFMTLKPGSFFAAGVLVDVPGAAGDSGAGVTRVIGWAPVFGGGTFVNVQALLQPVVDV